MKKFLALLPACLMLAGCTTVNTVENSDKAGQKTMVGDKRVITDSSLSRRIQVVGINVDEGGAGGLLRVQVELVNRTRSRHAVNLLWEWFDQAGMLVSTPMSTGTTRSIEGGESVHIAVTAPNPRVKDFKLKLIEAR